MQDFASKISGAAMLALAALPIAALATASHAATMVKVADIDVLTPQGVAEFNRRADVATRKFCLPEATLEKRTACLAGVKAELGDKLAVLKVARLEQASQSFAAR
ncbi:UrcA family protein [uncultured Phenylobacterium sp.]|uniref:UrcA family protein n=1 Tax=uncultured Phenylobacterium sp. TaxID=349273 RepID=UPI0025E9069B|nr:UrcA family protein [uncultured Phenylobacterium sp.]